MLFILRSFKFQMLQPYRSCTLGSPDEKSSEQLQCHRLPRKPAQEKISARNLIMHLGCMEVEQVLTMSKHIKHQTQACLDSSIQCEHFEQKLRHCVMQHDQAPLLCKTSIITRVPVMSWMLRTNFAYVESTHATCDSALHSCCVCHDGALFQFLVCVYNPIPLCLCLDEFFVSVISPKHCFLYTSFFRIFKFIRRGDQCSICQRSPAYLIS